MKKMTFLKTVAFTAILSAVLVSCGTNHEIGIKQVQLQMTKQEVLKKLGNDYQVVSLVQTPQGQLEVIRYTTYGAVDNQAVPSHYYVLHFLDGKLVELNHEDALPPVVVQPPHTRPHPNR